MRRNSMTEKSCVVTDERDFVVERQRLRESIDRFAAGGPADMHEASALLFRAADSGGMGGVDVSASGPSSAAVSSVVPARGPYENSHFDFRFCSCGGASGRSGVNCPVDSRSRADSGAIRPLTFCAIGIFVLRFGHRHGQFQRGVPLQGPSSGFPLPPPCLASCASRRNFAPAASSPNASP